MISLVCADTYSYVASKFDSITSLLTSPSTRVRVLDLRNNRVSEDKVVALAGALAGNRTLQALSMSNSPLDAVSATGPRSTHGKDKPGLGVPNSSAGWVWVIVILFLEVIS